MGATRKVTVALSTAMRVSSPDWESSRANVFAPEPRAALNGPKSLAMPSVVESETCWPGAEI